MKQKRVKVRPFALFAALVAFHLTPPFAPTFLKFDVAEFPGLFAVFFLGPARVAVIVLKNILSLMFPGTSTMYVGELMNVIGSIGHTLPAAVNYKYHGDITGARFSLCGLAIHPAESVHLLPQLRLRFQYPPGGHCVHGVLSQSAGQQHGLRRTAQNSETGSDNSMKYNWSNQQDG